MSWELKFVVGFLALPFGLFGSVGLMKFAEYINFEMPDRIFWPMYAALCVILGLAATWIL